MILNIFFETNVDEQIEEMINVKWILFMDVMCDLYSILSSTIFIVLYIYKIKKKIYIYDYKHPSQLSTYFNIHHVFSQLYLFLFQIKKHKFKIIEKIKKASFIKHQTLDVKSLIISTSSRPSSHSSLFCFTYCSISHLL